MTPGPIAVDERVLLTLAQSVIAPQDEAFVPVFEETLRLLRPVFGTQGDVVILPGSSRVGVEAAVVSAVEPGDQVLNVVNGVFGNWLAEMTRCVGGESVVVESPWDRPVDVELIERHLRGGEFKALTVVYSETSTGVRNPVEVIGPLCRRHGVLCVVDAVSAFAVLPLNLDEMCIDLCAASSQKGIGALLGLSMVGMNPNAVEALRRRRTPCLSFSLDLGRWRPQFFGRQGINPGMYPVLPSTHLVCALREACRLLHQEGLSQRLRRIANHARAVRTGVEQAGLELFPRPGGYSDALTAIRTPHGCQEADILTRLKQRHGILVGGSIFELKGQLFRIAQMGVQASTSCLVPTLLALEETLSALHFPVRPHAIVDGYLTALGCPVAL